jgi:hypothetical protein
VSFVSYYHPHLVCNDSFDSLIYWRFEQLADDGKAGKFAVKWQGCSGSHADVEGVVSVVAGALVSC